MKHRFSKVFKKYKLKALKGHKYDVEMFLTKMYPNVKRKIKKNLKKMQNLKMQFSLKIKLKKYRQEEDNFIYIEPFFTTEMKAVVSKINIKKTVSQLFKEITSRFEAFVHQGSNWTLEKVKYLELQIIEYNPLTGGEKSKQNLPDYLNNKHCLLTLSPGKANVLLMQLQLDYCKRKSMHAD